MNEPVDTDDFGALHVSCSTTADLLTEIDQLKAELVEARRRATQLERRLAETGAPEEQIKCQPVSSGTGSLHRVARDLILRCHPHPGSVTLYVGSLPQDQPSGAHDLVLWHPASTEDAKTQAEVADQCLGLAVTHGLSVGVVSFSEHLFFRLRLRVSEYEECAEYIEVLHFDRDYTGEINTHKVDITDVTELSWPTGFCEFGVETEIAISRNRKFRRREIELEKP